MGHLHFVPNLLTHAQNVKQQNKFATMLHLSLVVFCKILSPPFIADSLRACIFSDHLCI